MNAKLAEIGAELRQAREAQKLSLDDLSRTTLVHTRHLSAIEEGRDEDLPEPFYVKHFIRKYATTVGLSADDLANRFWNTQPLAAPPAPLPKGSDLVFAWWVLPVVIGAVMLGVVVSLAFIHGRGPRARVAVAPGSTATQSVATASRSVGVKAHGTAGSSLSSGLAVRTGSPSAPLPANGARATAARSPSTRSATISVARAGGLASVPHPSASELMAMANSGSTPAPEVVGGQAIAFTTRTTEPSWMQIVEDGHVVQSDVVPAGAIRKWTARRSLVVRIGNPGAVYGTLGNRPIGALGTQASSVFVRTYLTAAGAKEALPHSQVRLHLGAQTHGADAQRGPVNGTQAPGMQGVPVRPVVPGKSPAGHPAKGRSADAPSHGLPPRTTPRGHAVTGSAGTVPGRAKGANSTAMPDPSASPDWGT